MWSCTHSCRALLRRYQWGALDQPSTIHTGDAGTASGPWGGSLEI